MAGEFVCQIETAAVIFGQNTAHNILRFAVVIGPGGVEVIDTVIHGIGHHFFGERFINGAIGFDGQTHGAETQPAQLFFFEFREYHGIFLLFVVI